MAHQEYYLAMRNIMETSRSQSMKLIERVLDDCGAPERYEELCNKYIDDSIRIKKFKDKNHPKKPKSGYMLYCEKNRARVKGTLPKSATFSDIIKKMAGEWRGLSESEKVKFNKLAEDDKTRYQQELDEYKSLIYSANVGSSQ